MTKVLIVDDNETNLYMLNIFLTGHGYEVIQAKDGQEALDAARRSDPDLIISDILMPVMDGFALCRAWKSDENLRRKPFIFYTATYTDPQDEKFALSLGADRFLIKPLEPDDIHKAVMEVMEKTETERSVPEVDPVTSEEDYLRQYNQTLIKKLETKLAQLQDTNQQLETELEQRRKAEAERDDLQRKLIQTEKMEALGALAGGVAHDFNNILTVITGYSELAAREAADNPALMKNLTGVLEASQRGSDLIRQILTFSRDQDPELRPIDLNEEISQVREMLDRTLPRMIVIKNDLAPELWRIKADRVQLDQMLMNLAINAKDAMPDGGVLTFKTVNLTSLRRTERERLNLSDGPHVQLTVSDTGHGIDPETMKRIFEPFFTSKGKGRGTGLGLAVVQGVLRKHGAAIDCTSKLGRGAAFRVYFPALVSGAAVKAADSIRPVVDLAGREKILFVDDEPALREICFEIMTSQGYEVLTAESGERALEILADQGRKIALTLLDMNMPGMGGEKCLQKILALDAEARVIIASGYAGEVLTKHALDCGAFDYVTKPYTMVDLLAAVRNVLDQ